MTSIIVPKPQQIQLTQGYSTIVDYEDFEWLSQWKWHYNAGYAVRSGVSKLKKNVPIRMHREIMKTPIGMSTDHINHNGLDNQKRNLRICTQAENLRNRKGSRRGSLSKYLGVSVRRIKINKKTYTYWLAATRSNKKFLDKKQFPFTPEGEVLAALEYDRQALKHFEDFATLNTTLFPEVAHYNKPSGEQLSFLDGVQS